MDNEKQELILIIVLFGLIMAAIVFYYNNLFSQIQKEIDAKNAAEMIAAMEQQKRIADYNTMKSESISSFVSRANKGTTFNLDLAKLVSGF